MPTVADFIVERRSSWGVKRVFGYPGDGINGLMGALQRREGELRFVQSRHEELSAFMECAHASSRASPACASRRAGRARFTC